MGNGSFWGSVDVQLLENFFFGPFLKWLPIVYFSGILLLATYFYYKKKPRFRALVVSSIIFRLAYAGILTGAQYYFWTKNPFTQSLNNSPIAGEVPQQWIVNFISKVFPDALGYVLFYSWGRFWLSAFWVIGTAFAFYLFLKFLQRYKARFFEEQEPELGFVVAHCVGWPSIVLIFPIAFAAMIILSIFRMIFLRESLTTIGWPFIIAAAILIPFGKELIEFFHLTVLKL